MLNDQGLGEAEDQRGCYLPWQHCPVPGQLLAGIEWQHKCMRTRE
jgi:hypothetical protein